MFRNVLHLSLVSLFVYLSFKNVIAEEKDEVVERLSNTTDFITPFIENITNWLVETCSTYNTSEELTHHKVYNLTRDTVAGFDLSGADNSTIYIEETIIPMARGLLHGIIDEYSDHKDIRKKTAEEFVQPCNCTVLLTIGQMGNVTLNDTKDVSKECDGLQFAKL